ncbi:MAG: pyrroloquinoline-quinone synthase PqqC [Candidatus Thiothrix moscowensis]|nr:pyrroloquinoline-quinone synthase PqqC [Candidatus Thiothrix moscowensis]
MTTAWTPAEFEQQLRSLGRYYHTHHPFQQLMYEGKLNAAQLRGWVANRFYYQVTIPRKDAALLFNCPDREVRRVWIQRILDHDGGPATNHVSDGGIEAWLRLGEACGVPREELLDHRHVLPGVRFAVDAYINFVHSADWREGVCSSLTELFAPTAHRQRLQSWPDHYPWIDNAGLQYFRNRLTEAHRDVDHGLALTLQHFTTPEQQQRALHILKFKLDVLWTMLDAMYLAYIQHMPPYFNIAEVEHA